MISNSTTSVLPIFITIETPTTGIYIGRHYFLFNPTGGNSDRVNSVFQDFILRTSLEIRADTFACF